MEIDLYRSRAIYDAFNEFGRNFFSLEIKGHPSNIKVLFESMEIMRAKIEDEQNDIRQWENEQYKKKYYSEKETTLEEAIMNKLAHEVCFTKDIKKENE